MGHPRSKRPRYKLPLPLLRRKLEIWRSVRYVENPKYGHPHHGVKCRLILSDRLFHLLSIFPSFQGKLDSYRDILKRGKALNEDQQSAVDKYDEVGVGVITLHHATLVGLPVYFLHFIF